MPSTVTVYDWLQKHPEFANNYTRARETQAEILAEQIVEIADRTHITVTSEETGEETVLPIDHNRARLQVDARKWVASKLKPSVYGDKQQLELSGHLNISFKDVTDEDLLGELIEAITLGVVKLPEGIALPELTVAADIDAALDEAGI